MHHESLAETISGSRQLRFQKLNVSGTEIKRGMVTCDNKNDLPKEAQYFTVITMNHLVVIHFGYSPVLDCYTAHIARKFSGIKGKIGCRNDKTTETNPKCLKKGDDAWHCLACVVALGESRACPKPPALPYLLVLTEDEKYDWFKMKQIC